jgi:hypothetical protein
VTRQKRKRAQARGRSLAQSAISTAIIPYPVQGRYPSTPIKSAAFLSLPHIASYRIIVISITGN